mmetsp:Transcript_27368/g.57098  ORF Transcript_27368/g.57098 Transcript_27368/m.57098 type:complete len:372 (-) Transcript_27368:88-1203(-)
MNRTESQRAFQGTFETFDVDGNGTVDLEELGLGLSEEGSNGHSFSLTALKDLLDKFDANNNGVLEKDEFINLMHSTELDAFFAGEDVNANKGNGPALDLEAVYKLTPTLEETPILIKKKISDFDKTLAKIDPKKKIGCTLAEEKCPGLCEADFKLVFLRCEVFQVKLAVNRWIKYWDLRHKVFGDKKAFLPMTLEGAMKGSEKAISSSYMAVAEGVTDPDGRAIVMMDYREEAGDLSDEELFKAVFYHSHVAVSSQSAQKRGVICFFKTVDNYFDGRPKLWKLSAALGKGSFPARVSAVHFVKPPTFIKVVVKVMKILLGPKLRSRIYVHSGSMDEILESLSGYGLGLKMLPSAFGGNLSFSPPAKLTLKC